MRLDIDSDRWRGVPFYLRAGECPPATATEVVVRLRQATTVGRDLHLKPNALRFHISPEILFTPGLNVLGPDEQKPGQSVELVACREHNANHLSAYERVLGDAMKGDATLFARQDYAEEAWRIVDTALRADIHVHEYKLRLGGHPRSNRSLLPVAGTTRW